MPTPVSVARQCLTDEAARALDDAVAVARRRCHVQTTSLHAISALLALPSSTLRDACTRARPAVAGATFSPRLQLRALELSVGVSLDRLPSSKSSVGDGGGDDGPPISNSLMAAIKRSQANQRRHPDTFHLMQMQQHHQNLMQAQGTTSFVKVELKHFVLSILDDPIVSRVFGDAGFRSCDVKLALLQPLQPASRFFSSPSTRTRYPPVFLCNMDPGRPGLSFPPFVDENCRRVAEVLVRKSKRNPLLMGVYAKGALRSFVETVEKGRGGALFPPEMASLRVLSVEKEVIEFLGGGGSEEEKIGLKFEEVGREVEQCSGAGVVVSFGEVEVFVGDGVNDDAVRFVVSRLTSLLEFHGGKVWLVGVAETSHAYSKFLRLFPSVEKDWDLNLLTVTSATASMEGLYPKSSLMGSFVPFGGFFSSPSEIKSSVSRTNASFTQCDKCDEKYEQEVADNLKVGSATLASAYSSSSLPWLQKINEESTSSNDKISGCQKKWSDICQHLHHTRSLPEFDISQTSSRVPSLEGVQFDLGFKESSSKDPSTSELQYSRQISYTPKELHSNFLSKQLSPVPVSSDAVNVTTGTDHLPKNSETHQTAMQTPWVIPSRITNMAVLDHRSSSSLAPVTTDLGLGTLYTSSAQEPATPKLCDHKKHLPHLSESLSTDFDARNENTSHQTVISSSCSGPTEGKFGSVDFKSLNQLLIDKVGWQDEAICAINRSMFLCKSGAGKNRASHVRADIWFAFLGPDKLGKKKIASALAEVLFGSKESLVYVDLSSQDRFYQSNSIFECQKSLSHDVLGRKTVVDYIAGELSKNPRAVVYLENVDKADFVVQNSLLQAIRTGKFPDSHGREISINHAIFIVTSTICKGNGSSVAEESKMFSEERILEAKRCQIQLLLEHACEVPEICVSSNVKVVLRKGFSELPFLNKRKHADSSDSKEEATCKMQKQFREASRSYLDLNMPLDDVEEGINDDNLGGQSEGGISDAWLSDFYNQIDEKVVFKPFNFDALAEQVLKSISRQFQRTFGAELRLEIDYEVMAEILAAAWLSDNKSAVEDWVEHVLGKGFLEAKQKYQYAAQLVMKLVTCESIFVEEQASGVCLPARINLK